MDFDELCEKDGEKELQDADREGGWAEMAKCIEWRDKEIRELRTRVADLEQCLSGRARFQENEALKNRLSTLLKASEGMEKALEKIWNQAFAGTQSVVPDEIRVIMCQEIKDGAREALADFRAVKEGL